MKFKRIFLLIMDSVGVGEAEDASTYGSKGASTLGHVESEDIFIPNLKKIGLLSTVSMKEEDVDAYYTTAKPNNAGIDSLNGHYELMGIRSNVPFKTFNEGFPMEILTYISEITGRRIIGNKCSSSEEIINELGDKALNYGALIIYTSEDSDLQVAAHEDVIPVSMLHKYCEEIRRITLNEQYRVGRIIARPFTGKSGAYKLLNSGRRDYAVKPPETTILTELLDKGYNVIGIGKINDIFDREGINKALTASDNNEVINKLTDVMDKNFNGLCIATLPDFDTCGHRRDVDGYKKVLEEFDVNVPIILNKLDTDDLLIITADHGNDPTFSGNSHTRENVPVLLYSRKFMNSKRLAPRNSMADVAATIADNFDIEKPEIGTSILGELE